MRNQQNDRQQLNDLMNGWMHRDLGEWEQLNELFHPDGTIEITWFEGLGSDFVKGSMRMGTSDLRTKHLIASPAVTFNANGDKAILETNAIIIAENVKLNIGCECHNRFYDLAEKREGVWKLFRRQSIYDMGTFTFPLGPVEIDRRTAEKYPGNMQHWRIYWNRADSHSGAYLPPGAANWKQNESGCATLAVSLSV
jgi:hypothetical protein